MGVDMHEEIKVPYLIQLARKRLSFKPPSSSSSPRTCTLEGGRIRVNLRNNTVYPAWMKFYPDRSPWFPEVFKHLQFRRGSNNKKFVEKNNIALGPGRKKKTQE